MTEESIGQRIRPAEPVNRSQWLESLTRRGVLARLDGMRRGRLILEDGGGRREYGDPGAPAELTARVTVFDPAVYTEVALGGSIGVAEAYMRGQFACDDLTALVRVFLRNRDVLDGLESGPARLGRPILRLAHWLNRNNRRGSRRNIEAHYDLGNDFFSLFLDRHLMYSAAMYATADSSLDDAATHKLDAVCRQLELAPGDELLEIGTGWGGLALHAAAHYGARVTTTTISAEQYRMASARVEAAGLSDRIRVLNADYRDLEGEFDKLVSIEMFEAVGHRYFDTFFRQCSRLLRPCGQMLLQTITIADQRFENAKRSVDFIQRYIFPGGCLPSVASIADSVARVTDMRIVSLLDIGPHYARTLAAWNERFAAELDRVRALGFPDSFVRMWEWYLAYCEGGFLERVIGDVQIVMTKPESRRGLPVAAVPTAGLS
jgi:cyclopropane-fatty-acyl-phospholipid synthase